MGASTVTRESHTYPSDKARKSGLEATSLMRAASKGDGSRVVLELGSWATLKGTCTVKGGALPRRRRDVHGHVHRHLGSILLAHI